MCGRYYRQADKQRIAEAMHAEVPFTVTPSYNIAPQTMQPVIRLDRETGNREAAMMRWGLLPYFAKDTKPSYSTVNARSETVTTGAIYREPLKKRRCLVPADAFYEWRALDAKNKQPYAIALADLKTFAFAGLWDRWRNKATGETVESYTILTTDPNELITRERIHDRMPVILNPADYTRWLDPGDPARPPIDLLRPYPAERMTCWQVGKDVGNVRNDRPDLIDPMLRELGLFAS
jgi:putative SOS response-associated peptidase YedK